MIDGKASELHNNGTLTITGVSSVQEQSAVCPGEGGGMGWNLRRAAEEGQAGAIVYGGVLTHAGRHKQRNWAR